MMASSRRCDPRQTIVQRRDIVSRPFTAPRMHPSRASACQGPWGGSGAPQLSLNGSHFRGAVHEHQLQETSDVKADEMIAAVVFDMDGVLIDARDWHYDALNRALGLFGCSISRYDHLVTFDGLPTRQKLKMLSLERGLPVELHEFINELKQVYTSEIVHQRCRPVFQHEYALSRLKQAGYRLGVASNSVRMTVDLMMERSGLGQYLDVCLSNQDVDRPKPDPQIYLESCRRLGLPPEKCLVVEDNRNGIAAANAAGCPVLEVAGVQDVTYERIIGAIRSFQGTPS